MVKTTKHKFSFDAPVVTVTSATITLPVYTLKVNVDTYYAHKMEFVCLYTALKLKWSHDILFQNQLVSGWFNHDKSVYLLKLPLEGNFKCFKGNCPELRTFLSNLQSIPTTKRIPFVGMDIEYNHNKFQELLKQLPADWSFRR